MSSKTITLARYVLAVALLALLTSVHAYAQAAGGGGGAGAGGGGLGDSVVTWFYTNFVHALAAAGLLSILIGALFFRGHMMEFAVVGLILLALGNYQTILGLFAGL